MQGDEVGLGQHGLQGLRRAVVAHRQLRRDVVEQDLHADRLGQDADLRADVAVADDAERLAADLVGGRGTLPPPALVHLPRAIRQAAGEGDDLGDHQLRDAAGVAERGVEDGDAPLARGVEGHLVRADAEGPEREQAAGLGEHPLGDLGPAADPEDVHVPDLLEERVLPEGSRAGFELEALLVEELVSARVDVLQQEDPDLALGKRRLGRGGGGRHHRRYANFATTNVRSSRGGPAPRNALAESRIASRMPSGLPAAAAASDSRNRLSPYSSPAALLASTSPSE